MSSKTGRSSSSPGYTSFLYRNIHISIIIIWTCAYVAALVQHSKIGLYELVVVWFDLVLVWTLTTPVVLFIVKCTYILKSVTYCQYYFYTNINSVQYSIQYNTRSIYFVLARYIWYNMLSWLGSLWALLG